MSAKNAATPATPAATRYLELRAMPVRGYRRGHKRPINWPTVLPPSSRGLGRRPLTAETGVRIPVAVLLVCAASCAGCGSAGNKKTAVQDARVRRSAEAQIQRRVLADMRANANPVDGPPF